MTQESAHALYVGRVEHRRVRTIAHRLGYRVYMLLVDIDRIDQDRPGLLGRGRFGLVTWRAADHGDRTGRPLRAQIEQHLDEADIDIAGGPIRLLTMPRILGYGFNPISIWFCHRPDGSLAALLYEVTNTFHERHSYLVAVPAAGDGPIRQTADKTLFVSPFMDMGLTYDFTVCPPGEAVSVVVAVRRGETPILTASFAGARRRLSNTSLLHAFFTHPLLTWKVTWGIHWEALLGILKGARYRERGAPPVRPVTVGRARS
ncbi:DUF1365 family protein [Rhizobium sp. CRIBSB]|nr:DUF1365 family protein [Rhizobium sp. CRIBSB]